MASIEGRWRRAALEASRQGAILSIHRWQKDGRGGEDGQQLRSRVTCDAVSGTPTAVNLAMDVDSYDVTGDGQRFLINTKVDEPNAGPLSIILNWASEMAR